MAPFQHPDRGQEEEGGASTSNRSDGSRGRGGRGRGNSRGRGRGGAQQSTPGSIPSGSISKLKAQLRQTKRLLAKDDLTPDVRITSERRLKTLEAELVKTTAESEQRELEKKMAARYRGVKFFERQKVLRKIKQAKQALSAKLKDTTLAQSLLESRIDLYYILQYPKTQKYVALFPDGSYRPHASAAPSSTSKQDAALTCYNMRDGIKKRMASGDLGAEPEGGDLGIEGEDDVEAETTPATKEKKRALEEDEPVLSEEKVAEEKPAKKSKKAKSTESEPAPAPVAETVASVAVAETPQEEKRGVRETKQQKKERKEKKKALKGGKKDEEVTEPVADGWAGEDDFFS